MQLALAIVAAIFSCLFSSGTAAGKVIYYADFENGEVPHYSAPFVHYRGELGVISRARGEATYNSSNYSLRFSGKSIWNWLEFKLDEPMQLDQPVYLICALRSEGPTSAVKIGLRLEGKKEALFSETGPIGRRAIGRWERIVARLDQFATYLDQEKLVGIRFYQRCTVGSELPGRTAPQHELLIDDVRIVTAQESVEAVRIANEEVGVRDYQGPHKFTLHRSRALKVWHSPSIVPVLKDSAPPERENSEISITAARREGVSFQIVITPAQPGRSSFTLKPAPLVGPDNSQIGVQDIEWHPVRHVHLKTRLGESIEVDWPDPLSWDRKTEITGVENVVFWVTIDVPTSARPGQYRGAITVIASGVVTGSIEVPVEIEVLPFELPFRPTFRTNQQLWGPKKAGQARPWLEELAARKMFDANMWYSDAAEQKWRMEELGQNSIKVNMVGGHGPKPVKLDGHDIYSDPYADIFTRRLRKSVEWLYNNGWSENAFIYIWDENWGDHGVFDMVKYLVGLTRKVTNNIPILAALPLNPQIDGRVNIYLAEYSRPEDITQRITKGDEFWRWGNVELNLGKAPLATRLSYGFEAVKLGYKGAYSWGVNAWKDRDPWADFDKANWSGSFFYPGKHIGSSPDRPVPSIRMELLRDGIEDFEYITILRKLIKDKKSIEVEQAQKLIQVAMQFCDLPSERKRCDQDIDKFIETRKDIQYKISELSQLQLMPKN